MDILSQLAPYSVWGALAVLLLLGGLLVSGYFLLWIGLAASVMGLVLLLFPCLGLMAQAGLFTALALALCALGLHLAPAHGTKHGPVRDRRPRRLIGQRGFLIEPVVNGRGRARVGDTLWQVRGEDLPVGTQVEVRAVDGATLEVHKVP
jgi:membrane protein implicated in regulation of membrane protease activity